MGNTQMACASGGGKVKKVRVLLPDGYIVLLEGPVEAAELMIEHINHMVIHCSAVGSRAMGERTTMTILQPHEMLQPGQAYVVHPIPSPSSNKKTKLRPQPISVPKLNSGEAAGQPARQQNEENGEKNQETATQCKPGFFQRYQSKVADSSQSENAPQSTAAGGALRRLFVEEAREPPTDLKDQAMDESEDDGESLVLNLNMYMGWRPALESIPESPLGYHHPNLDMVQQPPLLCV